MSEPHNISFPKIEEEILEYWQSKSIFKKSLEKNTKPYSFYDGPPFATGLPHYGHLLPNTLKDIVPRYWTMKGFRVERRWGWDCHGLPIEQEIDKKHHFKSGEDIEAFGIDRYNEECREIVLRYAEQWEKVINRIGRWVDYKTAYRTMDRDFMESVWWVVRQLWDKGLLYRGYKSMQFSTALGTPLSNFEASSNYQEVQDPTVTVKFALKDEEQTYVLAWTTTPWTLPANLALAVGEDISYAVVEYENSKYILAEELVDSFFNLEHSKILKKMPGKDLVGKAYSPLFPYFSNLKNPHFRIQKGHHVSTEEGTGIVHIAPGHGEEDFLLGKEVGLQVVVPVNSNGRFKDSVKDYAGIFVKEADKKIIADLKAKGLLFKQDTLQHRYPYCPRTDTPLISLAVPSWFVAVEKIRDRLQKNNQEQTHWVPEHLRDGRFGKWLENARDWAISRNRFWGNPLPIWKSVDSKEGEQDYICIGSTEELKKKTGKDFDDLHRHHLDDVEIKENGKTYRRVPEVLDCWFESGSMPYAQKHYPFENKESFKDQFPGDFIAEGLDQTRGWFYTLSVLGTILFDQIPFRNVVVNGLILAEDGKKMSKRLKNYPDPQHILSEYGADALRLYLIDSPVIRAEELRFSEKGVREVVRKVLLKLWNSYSFYQSYASIDNYTASFKETAPRPKNILDRWIISRYQSLLQHIEKEMAEYHLYNVVPQVLEYLEELTNTYIRLNRARFWGEGFSEDKKEAFDTLSYILINFTQVLAPFAPFISEHLYLLLTHQKEKESVHLEDYPEASLERIDQDLEQGVAVMEEAILLARTLREKKKIKIRIPLKELVLIHRKQDVLDRIKPLEDYLRLELNVRKVSYRTDEESFFQLRVKTNASRVGPRAGKRMKEVMAACQQLGVDDLQQLEEQRELVVCDDFQLTAEDVLVQRTPLEGDYGVNASEKIGIALDLSIDADQEKEGLAREIVNRIQNFRKDSGLKLDDRIKLEIEASGRFAEAVREFCKTISEQTLASSLELTDKIQTRFQMDTTIEDQVIRIGIEPKN